MTIYIIGEYIEGVGFVCKDLATNEDTAKHICKKNEGWTYEGWML